MRQMVLARQLRPVLLRTQLQSRLQARARIACPPASRFPHCSVPVVRHNGHLAPGAWQPAVQRQQQSPEDSDCLHHQLLPRAGLHTAQNS